MKLGTNDIGSVYLGTNAVQSVYLGTNLVYSAFSSGLLDTYTGAAAAYSLRRLSIAYTGSAIRVRRASDNTEQDIGFIGENLDTSTLTSFCSGTDGFVKTWYDQSGNGNDATQSTSANQPQIVSSGSVITENGKPCVQFDGSDDGLTLTNALMLTSGYTFSVLNPKTDTVWSIYTNGTAVAPVVEYGSTSFIYYLYSINSIFVNSNSFSGRRNELFLATTNQSNLLSFEIDTDIYQITSIFNRSGFLINGNVQELIAYPSDQSSNRTGIETNINDFYSIY